MTKTQLEAVAQSIRDIRHLAPTVGEQVGIRATVLAIARALEQTRKGFDRTRFLRDCGVTP